MFNKLRYLKNNAFTLAEVLITLGIIGVVAAMTIPNLMQNINEKRTISQLIATQSILSRALRMAEEEYGTSDGWGCNEMNQESAEIIAKNLKNYLKLSLDCGVNDAKGNCVINKKYKLRSGKDGLNYSTINYLYKVILLNGTTVWWRGSYAGGDSVNGAKHSLMIYVDVNGKTKPNQVGTDLFGFEYYPGQGFIPLGSPLSTLHTYEKDCLPPNSEGWGCTYHVINSKDMSYLRKK